MTPDQRKWYFYWRGQVRDGQYPETDLSYIFVHVYELINNMGVKDSVDGYTQLFKLWTAYRDKYSKLDRYLTDWIADYLVVNKTAVDLATFYTQAMERKAFAGDPDILLSRYAKGSLNSLPMELIDRLSDYRPRKSKFYNDGNSDSIEKCLPLSVGRVDACLRQKKGKGILQSYHPDTATRTRRFVFQSALYAGKAREIELPPGRHRRQWAGYVPGINAEPLYEDPSRWRRADSYSGAVDFQRAGFGCHGKRPETQLA